MRVAIDTTPLQSGHKLRGIGFYTGQLIEALKRYENKHSYQFFTRGQIVPENADLVHYPYFDPFFFTLPLSKPKPTVVTVHDLIPIAYSQNFPRGIRGELKWQTQKLSLQKARAVITDSNASKQDIHTFTGFPLESISVVYLAPSEIFRPMRDTKNLTEVSKRLLLPNRFILYVGDVNWNKNISGLLRAFTIVQKKIDDLKLILVGKQFLNKELEETQIINALINSLGINSYIVRPGFVDENDLASVYSLATVYIQPSFAEGFGFPILEAMACGCPVVAANTSSLPEIAGPSKLVNPARPEAIADGLFWVFGMSATERRKLVQEGNQWLKRFSWRKVARETVAVYEKTLD